MKRPSDVLLVALSCLFVQAEHVTSFHVAGNIFNVRRISVNYPGIVSSRLHNTAPDGKVSTEIDNENGVERPVSSFVTGGGGTRGPPREGEIVPSGSGGGAGPPPGVRGGPPKPTPLQRFLEQFLEVVFPLLYLGDDSGVREESKNLRVLWTRALLANRNGAGDGTTASSLLQDKVAYELLPPSSRWVVGTSLAPLYPNSVVEKLSFVANRTNFIDRELDDFILQNEQRQKQVVVLGAGYDTRSLRYYRNNNNDDLAFYEVDLPQVSKLKSKLIDRYHNENTEQRQQQQLPASEGQTNKKPILIPFDLNLVVNQSIFDLLQSNGFDPALPTLIAIEAVLFYLEPAAVSELMSQLFSLMPGDGTARLVLTDNLSKVGVPPGGPPFLQRGKCEEWLQRNNKSMLNHEAIFGGAIHFVSAQ